MSKAGTKSAKHARPFGAEYEVARAIAAEPAKPIIKRRIALAACCGAAILAALATMPARDGTTALQAAAAKPAPIIRTDRTASAVDPWASVRREDTTGAISKKKKKSSKTKYMKAAEETDSVDAWFKKTFNGDDKTARKRTSAID